MTPQEQRVLNRLYEKAFDKKLGADENVTLEEVHKFLSLYFQFEPNLPQEEWFDTLKGFSDHQYDSKL